MAMQMTDFWQAQQEQAAATMAQEQAKNYGQQLQMTMATKLLDLKAAKNKEAYMQALAQTAKEGGDPTTPKDAMAALQASIQDYTKRITLANQFGQADTADELSKQRLGAIEKLSAFQKEQHQEQQEVFDTMHNVLAGVDSETKLLDAKLRLQKMAGDKNIPPEYVDLFQNLNMKNLDQVKASIQISKNQSQIERTAQELELKRKHDEEIERENREKDAARLRKEADERMARLKVDARNADTADRQERRLDLDQKRLDLQVKKEEKTEAKKESNEAFKNNMNIASMADKTINEKETALRDLDNSSLKKEQKEAQRKQLQKELDEATDEKKTALGRAEKYRKQFEGEDDKKEDKPSANKYTQEKPATPTSEKDVKDLPVGAYFKNPADGKIYRKK